MTGTLTFYDAAWPPAHPPATDGVCGYIGSDTPHVWTAAEWHARRPATGSPSASAPTLPGPGAAADVATAVARLKAIGAPHGTLVAWDTETAADAACISGVYRAPRRGRVKLVRLTAPNPALWATRPRTGCTGAPTEPTPRTCTPATR